MVHDEVLAKGPEKRVAPVEVPAAADMGQGAQAVALEAPARALDRRRAMGPGLDQVRARVRVLALVAARAPDLAEEA